MDVGLVKKKKEKKKKRVTYEANQLHVPETRHTDRVPATAHGLVSDEELSGDPSIHGGSA